VCGSPSAESDDPDQPVVQFLRKLRAEAKADPKALPH